MTDPRPFPMSRYPIEGEPPPPDETVVLVSSGIDSLICADLYPDAQLLFVDFKSYFEPDIERAACLDLFRDRNLSRAFLSVNLAVADDGCFIPARNLLLATLAAQYAPHIVMGGMMEDRSIDKSPAAFRAMSQVLTDFSCRRTVVSSPLFHLYKHEAVAEWLARGGDPKRLKQTWSCYGPGPQRCFRCKACFRWSVALRVNGIDVPMASDDIIARYLSRLHLYGEPRRWSIIEALKSVVSPARPGGLKIFTALAPLPENFVERVNKAAESSWIVLHTPLPSNMRAVFEEMLEEAGVRYHGLLMDNHMAVRELRIS